MFSILLTSSRILANTTGMDAQRKTVSAERMQEEWLEIQAAQVDPVMFRPLYVRYYEMVFRFIYRRTASEELSADICSQVFLKAMQRLSDYSFKGVPFSAWLFRIASNEVAQHFRQQQKNRVLSIEETQIGDMADEIDEDDNEALRAALLLALDDLKEGDMELIEMRFFEQRSFKEIADITGMTESNAKVKTYRILERLKKRLST
jgi:RNA polymerase sigma-70 factor (ECF subfamily)